LVQGIEARCVFVDKKGPFALAGTESEVIAKNVIGSNIHDEFLEIVSTWLEAMNGQVRMDGERALCPLSLVCTHVKDDGTVRQEVSHEPVFAVGHHVAVAVAVVLFHIVFAEIIEMYIAWEDSKE
jgi:hypothetical protein